MKKNKRNATGTGKYEQLMAACRKLSPVSTAVAHPCEESALAAAVEAAQAGLIHPILVGPANKLKKIAWRLKLDLEPYAIVDVEHSHAAAAKAVELIREGAA
ncbi:MAG TPA: phosphate acetyltransferase, partial [Gammaproteobacteria bacterium]|nr:phosphate acetyltransferase [Gammaproteobacteria bacterium]